MCAMSRVYFQAAFVILIVTLVPLLVQGDIPSLGITSTSNGLGLILYKGSTKRLVGTIGIGTNFSGAICAGQTKCNVDDINVTVSQLDENLGYRISWHTNSTTAVLKDCFDLQIGKTNWYGGPQRAVQRWPIEKTSITGKEAYVIKNTDNFAVAERYWLNSKGAYIFIDDKVPLFVDQNNEDEGKVCFIAKLEEPYVNREKIYFSYIINALDDPKEAHLHAVNNYLGKPTGYPDERMIKQPIWTTWAKYKGDINDETVVSFAKDIYDNGYTEGQIEIDDNWERCYGSQEFKSDKFSGIANTVSTLKGMGFRVTLWVHPFINNGCEDVSTVGQKNGYYVKDPEGNTSASWWDGIDAHQIDFTNSEAVDWYTARLKKLQKDPGIDSFKFDAGEVNYGKQPSVYDNIDVETIPNNLTGSYIRTCAAFGNMIEVRSAWRTQDLPIFTRMIDKDSHWDEHNGLYTLITTMLQMNMNGYPMVLPDMIGGNGYDAKPSLELIVRWTQANAFMPAMQFSYLPWDYTDESINGSAIVKKFIDLHANYSDEIIKAMKASVETGSPVNAPIWWIDPTNPVALATDDEFLLGENILVAPIYMKGATSRDVYLPNGTWKDGNSGIIYPGRLIISQYKAPIDTLPYFIKQ